MFKMDGLQFQIALAIVVGLIANATSDILVFTQYSSEVVEEFRDLPARFGPPLSSDGVKYMAVKASPADACSPISPPNASINSTYKWVVLIRRYNCSFEDKVTYAQIADYDAAIVYNVGSNELESMSAKSDYQIRIPSVFVGETTGHMIMENYLFSDEFALEINDDLPFNINTRLILPFAIVVGLCFVIMIGFIWAKYVRQQRRQRRNRLPKSALKRIPTVKFLKGMPYENCVICLDEYIDGDKLRVLFCRHAYHCKCIDEWLTKNRRVCPICKRKVFVVGAACRPRRRRHSSTDSLSESESDATMPLLNPVQNTTTHGTFQRGTIEANESSSIVQSQQSQRVNPFDRQPNLPPNMQQEDEEQPSNRFRQFQAFVVSLFTSNPPTGTNPVDAENVETAPLLSSSNNIMNQNLSGTFIHSGSPPPPPSVIAAVSGGSRQSNPFDESPNSQNQPQIGVAAIPNYVSIAPPPDHTYYDSSYDV